jgi:hypothetical protein
MDPFDIEDAGLGADPGYDDVIGTVIQADRDAAEADSLAANFECLVDLFGDEIAREANPDNVNPLEFVPETAADFLSLRLRMKQMTAGIDPSARLTFALNILSALTRSFSSLSLTNLSLALAERQKRRKVHS